MKMKTKTALIIIWIIIILSLLYAVCTNQSKTELILKANADYWEDYSTDIGLRFGDRLRETQLEMEVVYNRSKAIACAEGYYKEGSRAMRNHNPGNIKMGGLTDNQNHTIFDTDVDGWLALYKLLYLKRNLTIYQLGTTYAEDPNWANNVIACSNRK